MRVGLALGQIENAINHQAFDAQPGNTRLVTPSSGDFIIGARGLRPVTRMVTREFAALEAQ